MIEIGDPVTCRETEWHCLCGDPACTVYKGERLTVAARQYFPGLGPMLAFEERPAHSDSDHRPWFVATAFAIRYDS